jgi:hypothetical protein
VHHCACANRVRACVPPPDGRLYALAQAHAPIVGDETLHWCETSTVLTEYCTAAVTHFFPSLSPQRPMRMYACMHACMHVCMCRNDALNCKSCMQANAVAAMLNRLAWDSLPFPDAEPMLVHLALRHHQNDASAEDCDGVSLKVCGSTEQQAGAMSDV